MTLKHSILSALALSLLAACAGKAPPAPAPGVKVGKPYSVDGTTYYPEYDPHYDETGMASWYGPGFHGKNTANGERFDQDDLTAAHPTLPMPSLVRVTNEENGESAIIRVNDRGPFKDGRLIDLSRASAKRLGVTGLSKVRVQYLKDETEQYWADMNLRTKDIQFAANDPEAPGQAIVPPDDQPAQMVDSAPLMSVASNDIQPQRLQIRPRPVSFKLVGDAEAAEIPPPPPAVEENGWDKITAGEESKPAAAHPKVVQLYDDSGKPVDRAQKTASTAKVLRLPDEPEPAKLAPASSGSGGGWYVQAGSFSSRENAERLATRLKSVGGTSIVPVEVGGKTLHRVRVGSFATRAKAEDALVAAEEKGASGARVVGQ